jgi:hypothetical protein
VSLKNEMFLRRLLNLLLICECFQLTLLAIDNESDNDVTIESEDETESPDSKRDNLLKIERYKRQIDSLLKPYIDRLKDVILIQ